MVGMDWASLLLEEWDRASAQQNEARATKIFFGKGGVVEGGVVTPPKLMVEGKACLRRLRSAQPAALCISDAGNDFQKYCKSTRRLDEAVVP